MLFEGFTNFDIPVSRDPDVTIHGVRGGQGPPLLLLHGFPQTHLIWHKVAPSLSRSYTVIAPDLRGYGASSKPRSSNDDDHSLYAKSAMATDLAVLMSKMGFEDYFVCAHDRGARVAHKMMVDYPDKVKKCILLDICPTKAMFEATNMLFARAYWHWFFLIQPAPFPESVILSNPEAFAKKMIAGMHAGIDVFDGDAFAEYAKMLGDKDAVHAMCEDYRAAAKEDLAEAQQDAEVGRWIKCPVRVLWGRYGLIERMFDGSGEWEKVGERGMVDRKGSGSLDCGHYIPEEKPDELLRHIREFLA